MNNRFLWALALVLACVHPAWAERYSITDLGTLFGGRQSEAYGINDHGQVVGMSRRGNNSQAFVYSNGQMSPAWQESVPSSWAYSINNAG